MEIEEEMNNIWTIQSKKVLNIIEEKEVYYPNINLLNGNYHSTYKIVLDSFNNINKCKYDGLIYGFAKYGKEQYFDTIDELYQYFLNNPAITAAFNLWSSEFVILQLEYEDNFNLIPIDFNDFIQIIPPIWDKEAYKIIVSRIEMGVYKGGYTLPSFTQVHTPYIKKQNIVRVYPNFNKKVSDKLGTIKLF